MTRTETTKDSSDNIWESMQQARREWLKAKDVAQKKLGILQFYEELRYGEAITHDN